MNESSNTNSCVIELHYCLKDDSHSMDAFIFNECEREFLAIVREVIKKSGVKVEVETEALDKGGICCYFAFSASELWHAIIADIIASVLVETAKHTIMGIIRAIKEGREKKEQINEQYEMLSEETFRKTDKRKIRIHLSAFYSKLRSYKKVKSLVVSVKDKTRATTYFQEKVESSKFSEFIPTDEELDLGIENVDEVVIKNIYRVKRGVKYKWEGRYDNKHIRFNFKDEEQNEHNHFDEGSSIKCQLEIHRKIGNGGRVRKEYEVTHVYV